MHARNKTVVFRITREEYAHLKSACSEHRARSLSEFARAKVLRAVGEPSLVEVGRKLGELELAVEQLSRALGSLG